jgi:hypothetical protein
MGVTVDLVQVDVVGTKALQARFHAIHDMASLHAVFIGPGSRLAEQFRRQNHVRTLMSAATMARPEISSERPSE